MLRKRLITVLTFNDGVLFRTKQFIPDYRYTANFADAWSVDEITLLDITRPGEGDRANFYDVVSQFARKCFVPVAAGGGGPASMRATMPSASRSLLVKAP